MTRLSATIENQRVFNLPRFTVVFFATGLAAWLVLELVLLLFGYKSFYPSVAWAVLYPAATLEGKKFAKLHGSLPPDSAVWKSSALMAFVGALVMAAPIAFEMDQLDKDMVALAVVIFICCFVTMLPFCKWYYFRVGCGVLTAERVASKSL